MGELQEAQHLPAVSPPLAGVVVVRGPALDAVVLQDLPAPSEPPALPGASPKPCPQRAPALPGPAAPSRAAFELHREGCVCVVNVTVPATEASSTVVETKCLTELAKDLAIGPGSVICVQRATQSMVTQLNALPPPKGFEQKFRVLFQGELLIAARATLAMVVDHRMLKEWTDLGIMLDVGGWRALSPVSGRFPGADSGEHQHAQPR